MMFFLISSSFLIQKFAILVFMVECQVIVGVFFLFDGAKYGASCWVV